MPVPAPGHLIDIGGSRLHLHCSGSGTPTVVLEAALGASSLSYALVQPAIADFTRVCRRVLFRSDFTRVCSYDRAGLGWSEPGVFPRTADRVVAELRTLLQNADLPPPYVLVGHSYGGLTSRLFAARFPDDVCGLILLDPAYPEDWVRPNETNRTLVARGTRLCRYGSRAARLGIARLVTTLARSGAVGSARAIARIVSRGGVRRVDEDILAPLAKLPPDLRHIASTFWTEAKFFDAVGSHIATMGASGAQVESAPPIRDIPLVVMSGEKNSDEGQLSRQERLAAISPRGRHMVVSGSGHWIALDRPDCVIDAVRSVVDAVSASRSRAANRA